MPNLLITSVSATEGLARAILFRLIAADGRSPIEVYETIRWWPPLRIIQRIAALKGTTPDALFGDTDWVQLDWAIKYRHFLIHEGTLLNQIDGLRLIGATQRVFLRLEEVGRGMGLATYGRPKHPRSR